MNVMYITKNENEEMIVAVNAIYGIAWRSLKTIQDFNRVWTRDLTITGAMLYQLSYEAYGSYGSTSIVGQWLHSSVGRASHR